jgi:hypothetical protein
MVLMPKVVVSKEKYQYLTDIGNIAISFLFRGSGVSIKIFLGGVFKFKFTPK